MKSMTRMEQMKKMAAKADFEEKTAPQFINLMLKLIKENGGSYLVGNGVSCNYYSNLKVMLHCFIWNSIKGNIC